MKNTLNQEHIYFLLYNNVSGLSMARRYWRIPSSSFEVEQYPPCPSASPPDFRGYCPTSQDSEGILQYLLAMLRPLYQYLCKTPKIWTSFVDVPYISCELEPFVEFMGHLLSLTAVTTSSFKTNFQGRWNWGCQGFTCTPCFLRTLDQSSP